MWKDKLRTLLFSMEKNGTGFLLGSSLCRSFVLGWLSSELWLVFLVILFKYFLKVAAISKFL